MSKFSANIKKWWYLYLIALLVLPAGCYYLTHLVNLPRSQETITIFIASTNVSTKGLYEALEEAKPTYLREIVIRSYVYYEDSFSTYYSYFGGSDCDIVILPQSKIDASKVASSYKKWSDDLVDPSQDYFSYENAIYGKKIHSKGEENGYIAYKDEERDEDYYLFYGKDSIHLGSLSSSSYDTALLFTNIIEGKA